MHLFHFSAVRPSVEWMDTGWAMSCMDVYCTEVISDDLSTPKHVTQRQAVDTGYTGKMTPCLMCFPSSCLRCLPICRPTRAGQATIAAGVSAERRAAARFRPMINYIRFQNWLRSLARSLRASGSFGFGFGGVRRSARCHFSPRARSFQTGRRRWSRRRSKRSWSYILPQLRTGYPFSRRGRAG